MKIDTLPYFFLWIDSGQDSLLCSHNDFFGSDKATNKHIQTKAIPKKSVETNYFLFKPNFDGKTEKWKLHTQRPLPG